MLTAALTAALADLEPQCPRPTVTDLFRVARDHGVSAALLLQALKDRGPCSAEVIGPDHTGLADNTAAT